MKWYNFNVFLLVGLLACFLMGCQQEGTAEQIIEQKIHQIEAGIENKDSGEVLEPFYSQFGTAKGQDLKWVKRTLALYNYRHETLSAVITGLDIQLTTEDAATAQFNVLLTGGSGWLPDSGSFYNVETDWRIEDGEWMLVFAKWMRN